MVVHVSEVQRVGRELGFDVALSDHDGAARIEVPRDSGSFVFARLSSDGDAIALVAAVEVSDRHRTAFVQARPAFVEKVVNDVAAYLCLHDVEFQFDYFRDCPRELQVAARWEPRSGPSGLLDALRRLLRAQQGAVHRLRYWGAHRGLDRPRDPAVSVPEEQP